MWRLKIAEGGNSPYIYSTNNFVGRQIWEFDPEAGSPEELAEVEEARQNFYKNRHQVKPSSDLWRLQFLREKNFKQTIPQVKAKDGEEITYETATKALRRSAHFFKALQASDGYWAAKSAGPLYFLPPFMSWQQLNQSSNARWTNHKLTGKQWRVGKMSSKPEPFFISSQCYLQHSPAN